MSNPGYTSNTALLKTFTEHLLCTTFFPSIGLERSETWRVAQGHTAGVGPPGTQVWVPQHALPIPLFVNVLPFTFT